MGQIISYILSFLAKKVLWDVALKILAVTYYFSLVAMTTSFFYMLDFFISKIRQILTFVSTYGASGGSGGSSEILTKTFGMLNLCGFTHALNDVSGLISTAIVFLLSRILVVNINRFYRLYYEILASQVQQPTMTLLK